MATTTEQIALNEAKALEIKVPVPAGDNNLEVKALGMTGLEALEAAVVKIVKTTAPAVNVAVPDVPVTAQQTPAPVKRLRQSITDAEKLAIREIENEFLKATIDINRLTQVVNASQKKFTNNIEALVQKYLINAKEMQFDNIKLEFVAM